MAAKIKKGDKVVMWYVSSNRDETRYEDPDRFDIHRRFDQHMSFGYGIHFCLGAALARLEARIAWEELLARMPTYELAEEPRHFVSSTFYGWKALTIAP